LGADAIDDTQKGSGAVMQSRLVGLLDRQGVRRRRSAVS